METVHTEKEGILWNMLLHWKGLNAAMSDCCPLWDTVWGVSVLCEYITVTPTRAWGFQLDWEMPRDIRDLSSSVLEFMVLPLFGDKGLFAGLHAPNPEAGWHLLFGPCPLVTLSLNESGNLWCNAVGQSCMCFGCGTFSQSLLQHPDMPKPVVQHSLYSFCIIISNFNIFVLLCLKNGAAGCIILARKQGSKL